MAGTARGTKRDGNRGSGASGVEARRLARTQIRAGLDSQIPMGVYSVRVKPAR